MCNTYLFELEFDVYVDPDEYNAVNSMLSMQLARAKCTHGRNHFQIQSPPWLAG